MSLAKATLLLRLFIKPRYSLALLIDSVKNEKAFSSKCLFYSFASIVQKIAISCYVLLVHSDSTSTVVFKNLIKTFQ